MLRALLLTMDSFEVALFLLETERELIDFLCFKGASSDCGTALKENLDVERSETETPPDGLAVASFLIFLILTRKGLLINRRFLSAVPGEFAPKLTSTVSSAVFTESSALLLVLDEDNALAVDAASLESDFRQRALGVGLSFSVVGTSL